MKCTTGRGPKDKGRAFENEIRTALLKAMPSLSPNDITPRSMGDPGVDLILSQAARDLIPFAIELKRTERLNLKEALAQAEANSDKEHLPLCLIFRRNHSPAYAVLRLDDLLKMLADRAWNMGKKVVE